MGVRQTLRLVRKNLLYEVRWYLDRSFDRKYGTQTSAVRELDSLNIVSENMRHGVYYEPTPTKIFLQILSQLNARFEDFIFCDYGSGMGRTLLLASRFPFKRIIGVEFSDVLHRQAVENIRGYRNPDQRCTDLVSICMDAVDFVLPLEPAVLFFYNPFNAPVMKQVLGNIYESWLARKRRIVLVYYNPQHADLIENLGFLPFKRELGLSHDYSRVTQRKALVYHT